MKHIFYGFTAPQRLLLNTLSFISGYIVRFILFIVDQVAFVVRHRILMEPIPTSEAEKEARTIYYDMLFEGKGRQRAAVKKEPMRDVMVRQREYSVNEILAAEKVYSASLKSLSDYRSEVESVIKSDAYALFFDNLDDLIENSIRVEILLSDENKKGGKAANYGKVFSDLAEDFKMYRDEVDKFTDAVNRFQEMFREEKKFRRKIKSLESRFDNKFINLLRAPLEHIRFYRVKLEEIFGSTPNWHEDYNSLNEVVGKIKLCDEEVCRILGEEKRKTSLLKIQDKIRDCQLMDNPDRHYIGRWRLLESKMSCFLFSDMLIITQQKTELLSRKHYHVIKKQIEMSSILDVSTKQDSIFIKTKSRKYEIKINIKLDSLYQEILKRKDLLNNKS